MPGEPLNPHHERQERKISLEEEQTRRQQFLEYLEDAPKSGLRLISYFAGKNFRNFQHQFLETLSRQEKLAYFNAIPSDIFQILNFMKAFIAVIDHARAKQPQTVAEHFTPEGNKAKEYIISIHRKSVLEGMRMIVSPEWQNAVRTLRPDTIEQETRGLQPDELLKFLSDNLIEFIKILADFHKRTQNENVSPDLKTFADWALRENFARGTARLLREEQKPDTIKNDLHPDQIQYSDPGMGGKLQVILPGHRLTGLRAISQEKLEQLIHGMRGEITTSEKEDILRAKWIVFSVFAQPPLDAMKAVLSKEWMTAAGIILDSLSHSEKDMVLARAKKRYEEIIPKSEKKHSV